MTQPDPDPNKGIRTAGTVAIWVWVALALIPVAMIALCFLGCFGSLVVGSVTPSPSP